MSALSFKINAETDKLNSFINSLERLKRIISDLPSGTKEFDVINAKIAELEKRAEQSVKRIAEMQKAGIAASSPAASDSASVAKETSSYQELIESLNDVLGSRGQNIAAMVREQDAIRILQKELARFSEIEAVGLKLSDAQKARRILVINSIEQHKQALSSLRQVVSNDIKLEQAAATSMDGMSQSLSKMRIAYRQMTEEERKSKFGQELLKNVRKADVQIKKLDESIGNHQRSVGNYAKQWNGLQYQMQIVAKELPNFAISPQIGIMSLSNNLPYLVDELQKAKVAYKEYILAVRARQTDLQKVSPVWKQMLSSLFSWQTAVVAAVTLLTAYRKEIGDWVSGLFKAKSATKDLLSAEQESALARKSAVSDYTKEITKLDLLYKTARNASKSVRERSIAVNELQKLYPDYLSNLKNEDFFAGKAEKTYKKLRNEIIANALVRGQLSKMEKLGSQRFDLWVKERNAYVSYLRSKTALAGNDSDLQKTITANSEKQWKAAKKDLQNMDKTISGMANNIDVSKLFQQPKEGTYDYWQQQVERAQSALKQIKSEVKKTLDEARKQGKDLYSLGIDKNIVDTYKSAMSQLSNANKNISIYDNLNKGYGSKQENKAAKLKKDTEKYNLLLEKQARDEKRKLEDLQNKIDEGHIKAMDSGSKKTIAEMEQNFEEELQTIDREKEDALQKRTDDARSAFETNPKNKGQTFNASNIILSDDEIKKFDELYKNSLAKWAKEQSDYKKKSKDSWNTYYKEFGTYAQKRQAIIDTYNEKIKTAENDATKKSLEKHRDNELDDLDNSVQNSATLMGQLFADASLKSVNEIQKIIDKAELLMQYLESAKDGKGSANIDGKTVTEKDILDLGISKNALDNLEKSPKDVEALRNAIAKFKGEMEKKSPFKFFKDQLKEARKSIKKGDKDDIGQGISEIGSAITSFMPAVSEFGQDLGNILGNDKLGNAVSKVTEGLAGAGQAAMGVGQIMSGDVLGGVMSVVSGVSQIATAFKGVSKEQKDTERLESVTENISNVQETINSLIEKRIDLIKEATAAEASYLEATTQTSIDVQKSYYEEQFRRLQGNDILAKGGKHNNLTLKDLGISSIDDLKEFLSSEKLLSYQNNGYGIRDLDKWQELVKAWQDLQDKEEELADTTKESLTGISFDDAKDALDDLLTSTDSTEKKIADNFEDYMRTAILNMVKKSYLTNALQQWYSDFSNRMSDGELSKTDVKDLRKEYQDDFNEAQKRYKDMLSIAGIDSGSSSSQSSTSKSYESWSQTDADEVSGRLTALQDTGEESKNQLAMQTQEIVKLAESMSAIITGMQSQERTGSDMLQMVANIYLETVGINENTAAIIKPIKTMAADIAQVKKNTSRL